MHCMDSVVVFITSGKAMEGMGVRFEPMEQKGAGFERPLFWSTLLGIYSIISESVSV